MKKYFEEPSVEVVVINEVVTDDNETGLDPSLPEK